MIQNDEQLVNTLRKLDLLQKHIAESRTESESEEQELSLEAMEHLATQLQEEIVRYKSGMKLKNAG